MPVILTIIGISLLIFIHEAGHFLCARLAGIHVHVFSLGFGNRVCGFVHRGTDYRLSLLPLGGYVQVAGDDPCADRGQLRRNDLHAKGFLARTFFYSGGVLMNLLFALIVFPLVFHVGIYFDAPQLGAVTRGGAAWAAGLQAGDRILSVDDKEMYSFNNLQVEVALANARRGAKIVYQRGEETASCTVHPPYNKSIGLRLMGVQPARMAGPFPVTVQAGSPAEQAGLRNDDLLLEFDGQPVATLEAYQAADQQWLNSTHGRTDGRLTIKVRRPAQNGGQAEELKFSWIAKASKASIPLLGIRETGRRVTALKQGNAALEGLDLRVGDEIRFVNQAPYVGLPLDFGTAPDAIQLVVKRANQAALELQHTVPVDQRAALADAIHLGAVTGEVRIRLMAGTAADAAGLKTGDLLGTINGEPIEVWADVVRLIRAGGGKPVDLEVVRDTGLISIAATPRRPPELGFAPQVMTKRILFQRESFAAALSAGWTASMDLVKQVYVTLKKLFTGDVSTKNLGGIITIVRVSYHTAQEGYA
ncbi:MAG: site-2 protease family protein, partial [Planctomycetota bacterium]|nr:site-2 protease family protein [Planctomycetota bacterium]